MMAELKPCPFCGGKANIWRTNYHVYIDCENFNVSDPDGHLVQVSANTEEEAVKRWNRREGAEQDA